jgi:hypothetical protein
MKCKSQRNNYYKTYYQEHKDEIKLRQKENYNTSKLNMLV